MDGGGLSLSHSIVNVRVAGWGLSLVPSIVEVMVAGGALSLSLSLSVSFYVLEGPAKTLAEVFGNAAGLGSQPFRWRKSITQTDREVSIGLRRRRNKETTAQHPYLSDWKGTERERERSR